MPHAETQKLIAEQVDRQSGLASLAVPDEDPVLPSLLAPTPAAYTAEDIRESRELALQQANVAAKQLAQLQEIGRELGDLNRIAQEPPPSPRDWVTWLMLFFTAVAAVGGAGALLLAL